MKYSRRSFVAGAASVAVCAASGKYAAQEQAFDPSTLVDPMIGTGGYGHCSPAATLPFGAVQLGPDTGDVDWNHCSGYHYNDTKILGFSHTHLSGTGVGDMQDFRVSPGFVLASEMPKPQDFLSDFSHAKEHAEPGYYSVVLEPHGIKAEMTATLRCGMHRYTGPDKTPSVLFDLTNVWRLDPSTANQDLIRWAELTVQGAVVQGGRSTEAWAVGREIYFHAEFSQKPSRVRIFSDGKVLEDASNLSGVSMFMLCSISQAAIRFCSKPASQVWTLKGPGAIL